MARPRLSDDIISPLAEALGRELPGGDAHRAMEVTPPPRRDLIRENGPRPGAVLALLYPRDDELHLALTRRSAQLRHHGGQVSLPGGRRDPEDASLWQTALREVAEEIRVHGEGLRCLGALSPVAVPASGFVVQPYVAYASARPDFDPDPREVEALVELPLGLLLEPRAKEVEEWQLHDRTARVPFYRHGSVVIWGATAMILSELEAVLRRVVA